MQSTHEALKPGTFASGTSQALQTADFTAIEDKLNKKLTHSVEQLGDLMKDYTKKQRKYGERISDIESKLFGHAKENRRQK